MIVTLILLTIALIAIILCSIIEFEEEDIDKQSCDCEPTYCKLQDKANESINRNNKGMD